MSEVIEFPRRAKLPHDIAELFVDTLIAGCNGDAEKVLGMLKQLQPAKIAKRGADAVPMSVSAGSPVVANISSSARLHAGMSRKQRSEAWDHASRHLEFLEALRKLGQAAYCAFEHSRIPEASPYADLDKGCTLLDRVRSAQLKLLLTPAPTVAVFNRKKAMLRSRFIDSSIAGHEARVDAVIAKDVEWLKANARPRRKGEVVMSRTPGLD